MKIKWFIFFLSIMTISFIFYSFIEKKADPPIKIGVLLIGENRYEKLAGLKKGLADIGYKDKELTYIVKNANEQQDKLEVMITSLLNKQPHVIVTLGGIETVQLKEKLEKENLYIPVVFAGVAAPKELGLINDYRSPGGQYTGINNYHTSISGKRLELFKELIPSLKRVHLLYDEEIEVSRLSLQETVEAAGKLSLEVIPWNVADRSYKNKIAENIEENDGLLILPSFRIEALTEEFIQLIKKYYLPSMALYEHEVEKGFLAGHGASFYEQGYQAARYVSSIVQGNAPKDLPVELPDNIRFMVNKQVSEQLGVTLNHEMLSNAELVRLKEPDKGVKDK